MSVSCICRSTGILLPRNTCPFENISNVMNHNNLPTYSSITRATGMCIKTCNPVTNNFIQTTQNKHDKVITRNLRQSLQYYPWREGTMWSSTCPTCSTGRTGRVYRRRCLARLAQRLAKDRLIMRALWLKQMWGRGLYNFPMHDWSQRGPRHKRSAKRIFCFMGSQDIPQMRGGRCRLWKSSLLQTTSSNYCQ